MRCWIIAALLAVSIPSLALADQTVAGKWQADLGSGVMVIMDMSADGHWSSQTAQMGNVVAQMSGVYRQTPKSPAQGRLVFTPTASKTAPQHGAPSVENDTYTLAENGQVMRLTSEGDTMVFHRQQQD